MRHSIDAPEIVRLAIEKDWYHVFFIVNPVTSIVGRMVINAYDIGHDRIQCISIRRADTGLVCGEPINPVSRWYHRILIKLFCDSPQGRQIVKELEAKKRKFIVYASWMYPEVEKVVSSPYCEGYVYLEEGQQSYYKSKPYTSTSDNKRQRRNKILEGNINYYFREDASAYIGISTASFPKVERSKCFILDNFDTIFPFYQPRLIGIKGIGLIPAPHRIPPEHIEAAIKLLLMKIPDGGVIKLHPGFNVYTELREQVVSILERLSDGAVTLCDDDIIVELEMLFEPKSVVGTRCSLSKYAESFGSKYEFVQFDGYKPPRN